MKALKAAAVACCVVALMASGASAMQAPKPEGQAAKPEGQAPKPDEKGQAQKADEKGKEATFTGCVAPGKDASSFILTDVTAAGAGAAAAKKEAPKAVALSSTSVKIDPHSGHKVTVVGSITTDKSGEAKMTVTSLKMVSPTCP